MKPGLSIVIFSDFIEGRSSDNWVDFNFYGHQLVIHLADRENESVYNSVDGQDIPVPHFGVVLSWNELAERLKARDTQFVIEPYVRFEG